VEFTAPFLLHTHFWGYPEVNPGDCRNIPTELWDIPRLLWAMGRPESLSKLRLACRVRRDAKYPRATFTLFTRPLLSWR
jgi:hypothetical protein